MRLWGGRFGDATDARAADFTRSIDVDSALALDDLDGSIAHVHGLGRAGLLSDSDVRALVEGLTALRADVDAGALTWDPALEDVHLNLEAELRERVGPLADRLHTGRSRNDQVATDLRLWSRRAIDRLDGAIVDLERALVDLADREIDTVMPGTTHTQPAQPVLLAHHLLAVVEMLERDRGRFGDTRRRLNTSPLGSGAIAGVGFPLDRETTARELGFDDVTTNSIDAVGDRDFVVELLAATALCQAHLSRLSEEIVWWSNPRFGFVRVADAFSTGSSMLPNKRNPDPAELIRGHAARATAALTAVLGILKGLPLGYQRDLQDSVPPLLGAVGQLQGSLAVMTGLIASLQVDQARMREAAGDGFATATSLADALVRRGLAFRVAHGVVGRLVAAAEAAGTGLDAITDGAVREALDEADDDLAHNLAGDGSLPAELRAAASIEATLAGADVIGGTAPARVRTALAAAKERLGSR